MCTLIYKGSVNRIKEETDSNTVTVVDSKLYLYQSTDHPDRKSIRKHRP